MSEIRLTIRGVIFALFPQYDKTNPDTAKLVREVAIVLIDGHYVNIPCAGGGSVSSETGWDGRKKNEEDQNFRLRCWLQAAKTVKASRYVPTKRKGRGMKYYSKFFPSSMIFSLNKGTLAFETGNTRSVLNILIL